ncbi:hypothetical protein FQN57_004118 [Myotisia sp. PD_48]|nr:hypothetical protein FQN57_004118 [Myotisia sp. PD_48]
MPSIQGQEFFPDDPIFNRLLRLAESFKGSIIYAADGFEACYKRLICDILSFRKSLFEQLPSAAFNEHGLLTEEYSYIPVLSLGGYEFIIAFFTILSLGGACVPLPSGVLAEEADYFINKISSTCVLVGSNLTENASKINSYLREKGRRELRLIQLKALSKSTEEIKRSSTTVNIKKEIHFPPAHPGIVLFTSGTTGRPKAVVLPRCRFYDDQTGAAGDTCIAYRPPHWIGGLVGLTRPILSGRKLYLLGNRPSPEVFWKTFRDCHITHFNITSTLLRQLRDYYQEFLSQLPQDELKGYIDGVKNIQYFTNSAARIEPSTLRFWESLNKDLPFQNLFALTEVGGGITKTPLRPQLQHSIGKPLPGVLVKLSAGDTGEILVKSPWMLTCYLGDEEATRNAFDADGYFKTGDLAHRVGDELVFDGRAATDFIQFYGYRIPIIELESALLDLPYVSEAHVVAIQDYEAKEIAAALIRLQIPVESAPAPNPESLPTVSLAKLRQDLSTNLAAHKLPALLRILQKGEEVPRTVSLKPVKKGIPKQFFHIPGFLPAGYSVPGVEYWGNQPTQIPGEIRPWDWCGLQRAN